MNTEDARMSTVTITHTISVEEYTRWLDDDERATVNAWLAERLPEGHVTFGIALRDDGRVDVEHMHFDTFLHDPLPDGVASFEKLKEISVLDGPSPAVLVERFVERRFGALRIVP